MDRFQYVNLRARQYTLASDRRKFIVRSFAGAAGLFLAPELTAADKGAAERTGSCALDCELTQGPYYLDRAVLRRDVAEGQSGLPLKLQLAVIDARTCSPIEKAAVEIWHCDAEGIYSGYTKMNPEGPPGGTRFPHGNMGPPPGLRPGSGPDFDPRLQFGGPHPTDDTDFCRGLQISDHQGLIEFATVYPGWYVGRDVHIHLKVHLGGDVEGRRYTGGHVSHTGQLFFADTQTDEVASLKPYRDRKDMNRTKLEDDTVYEDARSAAVMLSLERIKPSSLEAGLTGTAVIRIDPSAIYNSEFPGRRGA